MPTTPTGRSDNETESEESVTRSSGSGATGSVRSATVDRSKLTKDQQQTAAAYWPLSRKTAAEIKKKVRKQRSLSTEEEDHIDDLVTDTLFKLCQDDVDAEDIGGYLSASFKNTIRWYRKPSLSKEQSLTEEDYDQLQSKPSEYNALEESGIPHKEIVNKILESGGSVRQALTPTEKQRWERTQKAEVQAHITKVYGL